MADMTLKWEAHDKNVVAELEKMNKAMEKLREQNRKLSEEGKQHHAETHSWMHEQVGDLGKMAAGYVTVEKGIEVVTQLYEGWKDKMKEVGQSHGQFVKDLMRDLTMAGDAAQASQIMKWTHAGGGTPEQRRQALAGVTAANPEADLGRRQELAEQVAKQAATGMDMNAAGQAAGNLSRFAPNKSADDVQDINMLLMQKLRGGAGRLNDDAFMRGVGNLTESGAMSFEQAMGMGASAVSKNQKLGFMTSLGELATASKEDLTKDLKPGMAPTQDQILKSQLAEMSPAERMKAVMGDHQMAVAGLGKDAAYQLGRNSAGDVAGWQQQLLAAQAGNIGSQVVGADSEVGRAALSAQAVEEQKARFEEKKGPTQSVLERAKESQREAAWEKGYGLRVVTGISQAIGSVSRFAGLETEQDEMRRIATDSGGKGADVPQAVRDELIAALKENTEATKKNTPASVNVDAHGE